MIFPALRRRVLLPRLTAALALAAVAGGSGWAGDKIELSAPTKKGVLPELPEKRKDRENTPFQLFDRGSSTGGAVESPGIGTSGNNTGANPRIQRRINELIESERNRGRVPGLDPTDDSDRRGTVQTEKESIDEITGNDRRTLLLRALRRERAGAFADTDSRSDESNLDGDSQFEDTSRDDRPGRDDRKGRDGLSRRKDDQLGDPDRNRDGSDRLTGRTAKGKTDKESRTSLSQKDAGEKIILGDPFAAPGKEPARERLTDAFRPLGPEISREDSPAARANLDRQQQFQQMLGASEGTVRSTTSGLGGLGDRTGELKRDRSDEFRSWLSSPSAVSSPSGGSGLFGDSAKSALATPSARSAFPDFTGTRSAAPSAGILPQLTPTPSAGSAPSLRSLPINIPQPQRTF